MNGRAGSGPQGVHFIQKNFATEMKHPFETLGGTAAVFDYDNDGRVDVLVTDFGDNVGMRR